MGLSNRIGKLFWRCGDRLTMDFVRVSSVVSEHRYYPTDITQRRSVSFAIIPRLDCGQKFEILLRQIRELI